MRSGDTTNDSSTHASVAGPGEPRQFLNASQLSRRRFLFISAATAGTAILAACGSGDDDDAPAATSAPQSTRSTGGAATAAATEAATPAATQTTETSATQAATATAGVAGGKKIFRTGSQPDVQNIDPAHITGAPDYQLGEAIFNFICRYTYDPPMGTDLIPELAESWDVSDDATEFTFHIRDGVTFHNGDPLTSEDIKWNWERIQDEETGSRYQTDFMGGVIEAPDANTVHVTFDHAYPAFLRASLGFRPGLIVSPRAMEEIGAENWKTAPVGSGPFIWDSVDAGVSIRLVRNENYWGDQPNLDEIIWRVKLDDRSAVLAVATGEMDAYYIDVPDVALDVQQNTDPNTTFYPAEFGQSPYWLAFHMQKPPLDDVRVRQALRYAIDVDAIASELFGGLADPIHSFLPPFMFGYSDDIMKFPYDPDKAKALLEEASDTIPSGWNPSMLGSGASPFARIIHEVVGSYWADVGVNAVVDLPEYGVFLERRRSGDYDVFGISVGRIEPDQIATPYWHGDSPSSVNNSFYNLADDLIVAAKEEADEEKRLELYRQLQDKISSDAAAAFIVAVSSHMLVNKRVTNVSGTGWQTRYDWFTIDVPGE